MNSLGPGHGQGRGARDDAEARHAEERGPYHEDSDEDPRSHAHFRLAEAPPISFHHVLGHDTESQGVRSTKQVDQHPRTNHVVSCGELANSDFLCLLRLAVDVGQPRQRIRVTPALAPAPPAPAREAVHDGLRVGGLAEDFQAVEEHRADLQHRADGDGQLQAVGLGREEQAQRGDGAEQHWDEDNLPEEADGEARGDALLLGPALHDALIDQLPAAEEDGDQPRKTRGDPADCHQPRLIEPVKSPFPPGL
mmetsp:Transcript_12985/g.37016  ORF Transcript_12985/g.37016 Transcript_12985/m.37016 type:complete len:251 (+) Transcript_12985:580-1332(+)